MFLPESFLLTCATQQTWTNRIFFVLWLEESRKWWQGDFWIRNGISTGHRQQPTSDALPWHIPPGGEIDSAQIGFYLEQVQIHLNFKKTKQLSKNHSISLPPKKNVLTHRCLYATWQSSHFCWCRHLINSSWTIYISRSVNCWSVVHVTSNAGPSSLRKIYENSKMS